MDRERNTTSSVWDDALKKLTDALGNSVDNTLDASGNRTLSVVRQRTSRAFDALGRLQQTIGQ